MALNFVKAGTKPCISDPILPTQEVVSWIFVRRAQKHSFTHQLLSTHVGAVGWEPHGSFPTSRATKVRGLTITRIKSTTYTDYKSSARFAHEF